MKIQLNKVCYGLPAKSFFIDYTVSQKRQLPVVKEFIVRLIHSLTLVSVESLQSYFGFSNSEILAVIDDLHEESLIEWSDDKIKLSDYASGHFSEVDGQMVPRFFEVADKVDTVHFEMNGFKMLPNGVKKGGANDLCISLTLANDCYKNLTDKAQSAFDTNFQQFREVVKEDDIFSDRQELYKINQVAHKYDAIIPIEVEYFIDSESPTELKTEYESSAVDEWDSSRSLFTVMDKAIPNSSYSNEAKFFSDYLEATQDPFLTKYWDDSSKSLNFDILVNHFKSGEIHNQKQSNLIIGNLYSELNAKGILETLKEKLDGKSQSSGLIWFTNADSNTWGRTQAISSLVSNILALFDKRKKTSKAVLVMSCNSRQEAFELNKRYRTVDAHLLDCTTKFGGDSSEILLIPNVMVACLHHAQFGDDRNIRFPVGYVSFDQKVVSSVTNSALAWSGTGTQFNNYFEKKFTEDNDTVLNKVFSPILTQ